MQQLTIRMPDEYFEKVQQIAKASGLKKSDITRMASKNSSMITTMIKR
jgi:predicted transcriptional regulator